MSTESKTIARWDDCFRNNPQPSFHYWVCQPEYIERLTRDLKTSSMDLEAFGGFHIYTKPGQRRTCWLFKNIEDARSYLAGYITEDNLEQLTQPPASTPPPSAADPRKT